MGLNISLLPKGGETIWGTMDWSPEEDYVCDLAKKRHPPQLERRGNDTDRQRVFRVPESTNYGRIMSFGKSASALHSSELVTIGSQEQCHCPMVCPHNPIQHPVEKYGQHTMKQAAKVPTESKVYTAKTLLDLLRAIAPKMMKRAEALTSHTIWLTILMIPSMTITNTGQIHLRPNCPMLRIWRFTVFME